MSLLRSRVLFACVLLLVGCTKSASDRAAKESASTAAAETAARQAAVTTAGTAPQAAVTPAAATPAATTSSAKTDSTAVNVPATAQHIVNRNWSLVSIGASADANGLASSGITLRFNSAKSVASGFGGCNKYSGKYTQHADSLKFSAMVSTKAACADATSGSIEMIYLATLPTVIGYRVDRTGLALYGGDGIVARFVSVP